MTVIEQRPALRARSSELQPAVTAVVPTHRRPGLMREAVQSIIDQTYGGLIEIVVVFDGCELRMPDVEPAPRRVVRTVTNERARGLAGARNSGILAAQHDFVAFLDDDDQWLPGKLAAQMQVFQLWPSAGLVGTAMQVVDGRGQRERRVPRAMVTHADLVRDRIAGLHSSSFVFRRDVLVDSLGMIDENLPGSYGEDYDVLLRAAKLGPVHVVDRPLVSIRWSGESFFFGKWAAYAEGLTYLLDKHPELRNDTAAHARVRGQIGFALAAAGERQQARRPLWLALRRRPLQARAWLGLLISFRIVSTRTVTQLARSLGRGI